MKKETISFTSIRRNKHHSIGDADRLANVKIAQSQWDSFLEESGLDAVIKVEEFGYIVSIIIGDTHISGRYGETYIGFNHNIIGGGSQKHRLQLAYTKPRPIEDLVKFFTDIVTKEKDREERRQVGSSHTRLSEIKWAKVIRILSSNPEYVHTMNALVDIYGLNITETTKISKELASGSQLLFMLKYPIPNRTEHDVISANIRVGITHSDQTYSKAKLSVTGGMPHIDASNPDDLISGMSAISQAMEQVRIMTQHIVGAIDTVMELDYYKPHSN